MQVYGVFSSFDPPELDEDGSVQPSETSLSDLRGRSLLCATRAVAEACIAAAAAAEVAEAEEGVVVVEGGDEGASQAQLAEALASLVVVPLPCLGLGSSGEAWEVMVGGDGCGLFGGVFGSEKIAMEAVQRLHLMAGLEGEHDMPVVKVSAAPVAWSG